MRTTPKWQPIAALAIILAVAASILAVTAMRTSADGQTVTGAGVTPGPGCLPSEDGSICLPVAPDEDRVDLEPPVFSDPTEVTNPLFPTATVPQVVMLGHVDGEPFRTEVTLLDETKVIEWNGDEIETLVSQYTAYLGGQIQEVALDFYAQADDGSVWYFGEDVFNYEDGEVADTHGTWVAGVEGPAAMIMPANPQVGDVYRPENAPPYVFEEVMVQQTGVTVDGPHGEVSGAILVEELHFDGTFEDKTFAPGYGEFSTGNPGGDLEAVALAVPTDALNEPMPDELDTLLDGSLEIFESASSEDWDALDSSITEVTDAWDSYSSGDVPPMLETQMTDALDALETAAGSQDAEEARFAALDVAEATVDFRMRYQAGAEVDLDRLDIWAARTIVDADAEDAAALLGDATVLEWIRDRVHAALENCGLTGVPDAIDDIRSAADDEDFAAATAAAEDLREQIDQPTPDGCESGTSLWGDSDCDGDVDAVDALAIQRFVSGLPPIQSRPGCPPIGQPASS